MKLTQALRLAAAALLVRRGQAGTITNATQLRDGYDFVVAGGGTAGLTVADRLSEAFPDRTVLVIEYGTIEYAPRIGGPPTNSISASSFSLQSLPNPGINNRTVSVQVGKSVGGSSCVNGMFFDRGSRHDYDAWRKAGSPEFDNDPDKWDWDGLIPFFKKSVTFTEPSTEVAAKYGFTWDTQKAYGGNGPINSTYPTFQWSSEKPSWKAWNEAGIANATECAGGDKAGICWVPNSKDPNTCERSHSGLGHYQNVVDKRKNYDLLVAHKVTRVIYPAGTAPTSGPPRVEFRSLTSNTTFTLAAHAEVIISAGAIHTPQILQRSGLGDAALLAAAAIPLVAHLPGVGANFHDHAGIFLLARANLTSPAGTGGGPTELSLRANESFRAEAARLYALRPAQGPYTMVGSSSAVYIGLRNITAEYLDIVAAVRAQVADGSFAGFLPAGAAEEVRAGYKAQLDVLAGGLADHANPVFESIFSAGPSGMGYLLKPLSRGSIQVNASDVDGEPVIRYGTLANPVDVRILASFIPFLRRYLATPTMAAMGAREVFPGANVTTPGELEDYVRWTASGSFAHPCCTAGMMPRNKGGVVGSDLKVHGVAGLRVADASIFPLIPGTHTSATVYAVGEKAADIIIREWKAKDQGKGRG